jgi:AcrR family transcriptional regulator
MRIERARRKFTNESNRYDVKRERLVMCARTLGEQGNAAKVSVTDVTNEMGITRGLFYYYFGGKSELNYAVADTYVNDVLGKVTQVVEEHPDVREEAVAGIVDAVREWMFDEAGNERPMLHVLKEISLEEYVYACVANGIAKIMCDRGLLTDYGRLGDEALLVRARLVTYGILGEARLEQEESASVQAEAACAALRYRKRRVPSKEQGE